MIGEEEVLWAVRKHQRTSSRKEKQRGKRLGIFINEKLCNLLLPPMLRIGRRLINRGEFEAMVHHLVRDGVI
jgi:hypothetical protein